ncbi:hypothetical protein UCDDA912_g05135 [Diaporthe ampelina]|uniref:Uncharacterized protein n=1 Tax=Diaporthe ampelina TaxID=1214573 RepID=A0A0G2HIK1_9PEZI|nr:hypothetical protein UCDDA912_g05135 [Diaporthe ampelina]
MMASIRSKSLREHFSNSGSKLRPIVTSLNGDNSWLMSFPIPDKERQQAAGKTYFHLVTDPWLAGPAITLSTYGVSVALPEAPAAKNGEDVEAIVREIEGLAKDAAGIISTTPTSSDKVIDLISIGIELNDHKHDDTLRSFRSNVPVLAAPKAAAAIRALNHFDTVVDTLDLTVDTPSVQSLHPGSSVLPPWLNIFRLTGYSFLNFATAIIWSHTEGGTTKHEVILASPHSIKAEEPSVQKFLSILGEDHNTTVLALLHSLKENYSRIGQHTFGVLGGLALERPTKPKYWIQTADAKLLYSGVVMWLLATTDVFHTLDWGLQKEAEKNDGVEGMRPNCLEVKNGECLVLN